MRLLTRGRPWETTDPRRAAVSSFGISGTNAHVIIEEAPQWEPAPSSTGAPMATFLGSPTPLVLSARAPEAVDDYCDLLLGRLQASGSDPSGGAGIASAMARRATLPDRLVVWGRDATDLASALAAARTGTPGSYRRGRAPSTGAVTPRWWFGDDVARLRAIADQLAGGFRMGGDSRRGYRGGRVPRHPGGRSGRRHARAGGAEPRVGAHRHAASGR